MFKKIARNYVSTIKKQVGYSENLYKDFYNMLISKQKKSNKISLDFFIKEIHPSDIPKFLFAFNLHQQKKYNEAKIIFNDLVATYPDSAYLNFRYGMVFYKLHDWNNAYHHIKRAIELDPTNKSWKVQLSTTQNNLYNQEKETTKKSIEHYKLEYENNPNDPECIFAYAEALFAGKQYWMAKAQFEKYVTIEPYSEYAFSQLGKICEVMTNYEEAIKYFGLASNINPMSWVYKYHLGYSYERLGNIEQANVCYELAISLSSPTDELRLEGVGAIHYNRGLWDMTSIAYENLISQREHLGVKIQPEIYQKLGVAYDRQYMWDKAAKSFEIAINQSPIISADWCFNAGQAYERSHDYGKAEYFYRKAVARAHDYKDYWYYRLGIVCEKNGNLIDSNRFYQESRRRKIAHAVAPKSVIKNKEEEFLSYYTEYYETLDVDDNLIMFESFLGANISCNPYAILMHLIDNDYGFTYLIALSDVQNIDVPEKLKFREDVIFVKRGSDLYLRSLCRAKYLVNNVSFPFYFIRKPNQVYLNTWHGTPMKTLGKDIKTPFADYGNVSRNFLQATHIISPNRHTTDVILNKYDIRDIYSGKIAETGYPRIDATVNLTTQRKKILKDELGISDDKPIVFYAPTWRGDTQSKNFDTKKLQSDLKKLHSSEYHLIFRGHHFIEKLLKDIRLDVIIAPHHLDSNELLGLTDVLISDYSSIMYDFLALNRSIICYIYDFEEYKQERGLYFDVQDLPGQVCNTVNEVKTAILSSLKTVKSNATSTFVETYACFDDGHATERVVDFFLYDNDEFTYNYSKKKTNLFFVGPFLSNGICASFINLLTALETPQNNTNNLVLINPSDIANHESRLLEFHKLPTTVSIYPRLGKMPMTLEELWVKSKFESTFTSYSSEFKKILDHIYQRECRRLFGDSTFNNIINFEGYNLFWVFLLSQMNAKQKIIYQHNDKYQEWKTKFPYLQGVFSCYSHYDKIVSVSEKTMENNRENLATIFNIPNDKFKFCNNPLNIDGVTYKTNEHIVFEDEFSSFQGYKLLTIGRMSHEKDHMKLIRAFKQICNNRHDVRLFIIGSGPLEQDIKQLIQELGLENDVFLLGQKLNPFPYLKQADVFVLPSNHEGQPMVLLEALILKKPIIATDIVGNRSILGDEYGLLVDNSESGLVFGINEFIEGKLSADNFDAHTYQQEAINKFNSLLEY